MKKANFNTLKNLSVPGSWIENALAIPEKEEQKPAAVPLWKKPRFIAMAASLVLVSALSIALFLTMGSKHPVAVKSDPQSPATEIVRSTDAYGAIFATEVAVAADNQSGTEPTEAKSGIVRFDERLFGADDNTAPTTAPGQNSETTNKSPTTRGKTNPTTKPNAAESGTPSVKPTESGKPSDLPDEPPTGPGWEMPSEAVWVLPTAAPEFPDDATEPPHPTELKPTEDPEAKFYQDSLSARIAAEKLSAESTLYIRLIDGHGKLLGDTDLYADQHLVTVEYRNSSYVGISYTPKAYGIIPQRGIYRYYIYDQNGVTVYSSRAWLNP